MIFDNIEWGGEELKERLKEVDKEKKLTGVDIKKILIKYVNKPNIYKTEKSWDSQHPLDLVIGNEDTLDMVAIEIKGDTDSYARLKDQINNYRSAFDEVFIAIHKKKIPEWLPIGVGVLRVFDDGKVLIEQHSHSSNYYWDISTNYEWDALWRANNLGPYSNKIQELLKLLSSVRQNVLFNRFFSVFQDYTEKKFNKYYPFSDEQREMLMGLDVPNQMLHIKKEISKQEKRLKMLKSIVNAGQETL